MPSVHESSYRPPLLLGNGHLQTIYPSFFRTLPYDLYTRERITTPDDDFLDLDWARVGGRSLAILSHGLEGSSHRPYMIGMARAMNRMGWDALAWNYRGCSGEINRQLRFYHNGSIDDLETVVQHACRSGRYDRIALIGFSLGGNLTLVYLGSKAAALDCRLEKAVVFSVPCDLAGAARCLSRCRNRLYMVQFLESLHEKIRRKMTVLPGKLDDAGYEHIRTFKDFDDRYTAPLHGFASAEDYWRMCSSSRFLSSISLPTLIVNAKNDPFLSAGCYPIEAASSSPFVHLEMPRSGGHVGFVRFVKDGSYWSEARAAEFLRG